jgi:hypothetical protein
MQAMLTDIEAVIEKQYEKIRQQGKILSGIEEIYRQVRFESPELAAHIKKRMLDLAEEKGDLP